MLPKALKSCPKSKKSPDLVTLIANKMVSGRSKQAHLSQKIKLLSKSIDLLVEMLT